MAWKWMVLWLGFLVAGVQADEFVTDIVTHKQAYQLSTQPSYPARLAVDNKTDNCYHHYSSTEKASDPWWGVDLGGYFKILWVHVTPKNVKGYYIMNYTVYVGNVTFSNKTTDKFIFCTSGYGYSRNFSRCDSKPVASHLVIQRNGYGRLPLCEVVVHGETSCARGMFGSNCTDCPSGRYGWACSSACSRACVESKCDNVTGICDSCPAGLGGDLCNQECRHGLWGPACGKNCSAYCQDQFGCNRTNGNCPCRPGYTGATCEQIDAGGESSFLFLVLLGILAALVLALIVTTTVFCLCRRAEEFEKKRKDTLPPDGDEDYENTMGQNYHQVEPRKKKIQWRI